MSRVVQQNRFASGDTLRPTAPNEELEELLGEMNGHIDRDNVPTQLITGVQTEVGLWNTFLHLELTGGTLQRDSVNSQQWIAIMSGTMITGDGRIQIEAEWSYQHGLQILGLEHFGADLGIRVDGEVHARSGTSGGSFSAPLMTTALPAVGPGEHLVEAVVRLAPDFDVSTVGGIVWTHIGGMLLARYLRR